MIDSWFEGEWSYGATDLIPYSQFVYDKTQKSVTTGFEAGAALDDDYKVYDSDIASLSLTYINNSYVNAGNYTAVASLDDEGAGRNYSIRNNGSIEWEILPKTISVIWISASPYSYDRTEKSVEAVITNLEAGDEALIVMLDTGEFEDGRKLNHTAVDAGLYRAKIVSVDNPNYTIEGAFNTVYDWEITKAVISGITMSDKTEVYNGQPQAIYVAEPHPIRRSRRRRYYITPYGGQTSSGNSAVEVHIYEGQVSYYTVRAN